MSTRHTLFATLATLSAFSAALLLPTRVDAQTTKTFDLPTAIPIATTNNYPFAGPIMRYQQWYAPSEWISQAKHPVRVKEV